MEHSTPNHTPASIGIFILAGLFNWFQSLTAESAEQAYTWIFRGLSVISIVLIIIINLPKAKEVLFKKKNKDGII